LFEKMLSEKTPSGEKADRKATGSVGVAGAGLIGRLLALRLADQGWQVTLFDRDAPDGAQSCGYAGAGMLSPFSELESAEPIIAQLGLDSLPLWRKLVTRLAHDNPGRIFMQEAGTLVVAHPLDSTELERFTRHVRAGLQAWQEESAGPGAGENSQSQNADPATIRWHLSACDVAALEPELDGRFSRGIFLPDEGQIDNRRLFAVLQEALTAHSRVEWIPATTVERVEPGRLVADGQTAHFDWAMDCRGLGARPAWAPRPAPDGSSSLLRGVRGELLRVRAPEVSLNRPIRLMHPRHPLYVVPRPAGHFLIGATSIESDDRRPMTVQSAMELLSAALTVHPGFAEATIEEMTVQCRPALPDNRPRIRFAPGLARVNGLYRHGFLVAPKLVELIVNRVENHDTPNGWGGSPYHPLFEEEEPAHAVAC
jgi:glycine oxidase